MGNAWALLPIEHWTQPSGAQVWLIDSPTIPMVDVQLAFDAGSRRDPAAQAGLARSTALMLDKGIAAIDGAPAMDENALGEAWADLGASFGAAVGQDSFSFALRSLTDPDLLKRATALAARSIAHPSWPQDIWQRERARWSAAIEEANTRPSTVVGKAFSQAVYGNHPYGYQVTAETLASIQVADMQAMYQRAVVPCRAKVVVVGALNRAKADQLVEQLLAPLARTLSRTPEAKECAPLAPVPEVQALADATRKDIPFPSAQAQVLIGQPGIRRNDPDFLALLVGNHILGGSGFTSRLMSEVREKRGLSYSVNSSFSPGLNAGAFVVGLQTRPDQAEQAVQVSQKVIKDFVANGPTEQELRAAKDNLIGGFALRIDSNGKLLANVSNMAWNGLPLDYLDHWSEKVQALTVADVRAAMAKHLQPERMVTVVVGAQP